MKKVALIIILCVVIFFSFKSKLQSCFTQKINLNIQENEFGIIFYTIEQKRYMVVASKDKSLLVLIDKVNHHKNVEILKKLGIFEYEIRNLDTIFSFNDIIVKQEQNLIKINQNSKMFCVSNGKTIPKECSYVYLLKESDFENMKLVFYHDTLSKKYEEQLYEKWVDLYKLNGENITFVKFYEDTYSVINISKNMID